MHVAMIVKSDVINDARVRREASTLRDAGHHVTILGDRRPEDISQLRLPLWDGIDVRWVRGTDSSRAAAARAALPAWVRWAGLPIRRRRQEAVFQASATADARALEPVDVVHAHDLSALGAATTAAQHHGARLVYDAHECWTGRALEGRPTPVRDHLDRRREARLGGRADAVITVSPGLGAWLERTYGWADVEVVANSFPKDTTSPAPPVRPTGLLYAGRIDRKRDLMTVAAAARRLPDLGVTVMGGGDLDFARELASEGLDVRPPSPIDDVDEVYRRFGVALVTLSDDSLNHRLALPNKVFHAVRAAVPVIAADLPELGALVRRHQLGTTYRCGDPASLVRATEELIANYEHYGAAVAAATDELSWDRDASRLLAVYDRLSGER